MDELNILIRKCGQKSVEVTAASGRMTWKSTHTVALAYLLPGTIEFLLQPDPEPRMEPEPEVQSESTESTGSLESKISADSKPSMDETKSTEAD